jgi:hypothetical protein
MVRYLRSKNALDSAAGSRICGLSVCQSIVDLAICDQAQARQRPPYGVAMPDTVTGGRYSSSVQFLRQRALGNEACRYKLSNGREQSSGAGVRGSLAR